MLLPADEFNIYRYDRDSRGGGVCLIVRNMPSITSQQVSVPSKFSLLETVCVDVCVNTSCGVRIIAVYIPPRSHKDVNLCSLTIAALEYLSNTGLPVCIMGDFNLPLIDWSNNSTADNDIHSKYLTYFMSNSFNQVVNFPTRDANILDLIFIDDPTMISNVRKTAPLGSSDHLCILFNLEFVVNDCNNFIIDVDDTSTTSYLNLSYYNLNKIEWPLLIESLSGVDWIDLFNSNYCVDKCWEQFYYTIVYAVSLYAPAKSNVAMHKRASRNRNGKLYKSYPKHIRKLSTKKVKSWRRYKSRPSLKRKATYNKHTKAYKIELNKHISSVENKLIYSKNCRSFFNYVNKKIKPKGSISTLMDASGSIITGDLQKANILSCHFSSVFVHDNGMMPDPSNVLLNSETENNNYINTIYFSSIDISNQIRKLRSNSAPGCDGISATLLKKLIHIVSFPLSMLFNLSMSSSTVPKSWKRSIVIPIYKKGDAKSPTNYRPISLTSLVSKLMEGVIKDSIVRHCKANNLLSDYQFGFMPRRSANLQLIQYHDILASNYSKGYQSDSVYLDFKAAFDSVVHSKLLYKLKHFGISGDLINWIESFLSERFYSVRVGTCYSEWSPVFSGVPQGSVLGPLLFILFINDLIECSFDKTCNIFVFADDAKCFSCIKTYEDCEKLQSTLNAIDHWSIEWQLPLSLSKCQVMSFNGRNAHITYQYYIRNCTLSLVDTITDLGVILSSDFSFSKQVDKVCSKARCRSAMILKCFQSRDKGLLFRAFNVYVRPILEYCCNVWSPYRLCDTRKIESVQRLFTKRLRGMKDMPYPERLKCLSAESLEIRRIKYDLTMYFKILHELVDINSDSIFQIRDVRTRSNGLTLFKAKFNCNTERYIFRNRCINIWNLLPQTVVGSSGLSLFKSRLNSIDLYSVIQKASLSS